MKILPELGLTFDDVLLAPQHSDVESRRKLSTQTRLTQKISLQIPIVSANMDTVTESEMAIAMARAGGIGIIHRFMPIEQQVQQIARVKKAESFIVDQPITLTADHTIGDARRLVDADAVKVGVGSGSICITRVVAGAGVPQLSAIIECAQTARDAKIPIIADGGIRQSGDAAKALAAGASSVMLGSLLAGTVESPGLMMTRQGHRYKVSQGMASLGANLARKRREGDAWITQEEIEEYVSEGVEAAVPYRGSVREVLTQLVGGIQSGMSYSGAHSIEELNAKAVFVRMTGAGLKESHPHDVEVL